MNVFFWGAIAMACWVAGLFFRRYWTLSRDRLFLFFWLAFWMLATHYVALAVLNPPHETRHYVYLIRFAAFALIAIGIIDKNRTSKSATRR
jgi:hypothetical protein